MRHFRLTLIRKYQMFIVLDFPDFLGFVLLQMFQRSSILFLVLGCMQENVLSDCWERLTEDLLMALKGMEIYDLSCIAMHTEYSVVENDNNYVEKQRLLCNLLFYFHERRIEFTRVHHSVAKSIVSPSMFHKSPLE